MSVFNKHNAHSHAMELIKAGLQSKAIELRGAGGATTPEAAAMVAAIDAKYLNELINSLAANLTAMGDN